MLVKNNIPYDTSEQPEQLKKQCHHLDKDNNYAQELKKKEME